MCASPSIFCAKFKFAARLTDHSTSVNLPVVYSTTHEAFLVYSIGPQCLCHNSVGWQPVQVLKMCRHSLSLLTVWIECRRRLGSKHVVCTHHSSVF